MSAQCATCSLRAHKLVTSKCKSVKTFWKEKKMERAADGVHCCQETRKKVLTARLCEDSRVMHAMVHFYLFISTRGSFFFFSYNFCSAFLLPSLQWRQLLSGISVWFALDVKTLFLDIKLSKKKKLFPFLKKNKKGWEKTFTQGCDDVTNRDKEIRGALDIKRRKWTGPQLARHDCIGRSCLLTFRPMHFRKWLRVLRLVN